MLTGETRHGCGSDVPSAIPGTEHATLMSINYDGQIPVYCNDVALGPRNVREALEGTYADQEVCPLSLGAAARLHGRNRRSRGCDHL